MGEIRKLENWLMASRVTTMQPRHVGTMRRPGRRQGLGNLEKLGLTAAQC